MTEPRIVVRVAERMVEPLKPRLEAQIAASGYAGKVMLVGEPSLSAPDCKIEWADGGAEIDTAAVWRHIDESLARFVTAPSAEAGRDAPITPKRPDQ